MECRSKQNEEMKKQPYKNKIEEVAKEVAAENVRETSTCNFMQENNNKDYKLKDSPILRHLVEFNIKTTNSDKIKKNILSQTLEIKYNKLLAISQENQTKIIDLKNKYDLLNQELLAEQTYCPRIEREINNTIIMKDMLKEHVSKINIEYNNRLIQKNIHQSEIETNSEKFKAKTSNLKHSLKILKQKYDITKSEQEKTQIRFCTLIQNEDNEISLQENRIKFLQDKLKCISNEYQKNQEELKNYQDIETKSNNYKNLLNDKIKFIHNEKLLEEKLNIEDKQVAVIDNMKQNIVQTKTDLENLNSSKTKLQKEIDDKINNTIELEKQYNETNNVLQKLTKENKELEMKMHSTEADNIITQNIHTAKYNELNSQINDLVKKISDCIHEEYVISNKTQEVENDYKICITDQITFKTELHCIHQQTLEHNEMSLKIKQDNTQLKHNLDELKSLKINLQNDLLNIKTNFKKMQESLSATLESIESDRKNITKNYNEKLAASENEIAQHQLENETIVNDMLKKNAVTIENLNKKINLAKEALIMEENRKKTLYGSSLIKERNLNSLKTLKEKKLIEQKNILKEYNDIKPQGILKPPNVDQIEIKHVSFQQHLKWDSGESSADESLNILKPPLTKSAEELWNEMKNIPPSPPEKL